MLLLYNLSYYLHSIAFLKIRNNKCSNELRLICIGIIFYFEKGNKLIVITVYV